MKKSLKNYFTTGELAQCCNILRKTLLFYDKKGLIIPECILENGYRYYKRTQLFLLELIITLRKLEVPVCSIKDYLEHRSLNNYEQMLQERQWYYQKEIERMQIMNNALIAYLQSLQTLKNITFDTITTNNCPEYYLVTTKGVRGHEDFKKRSEYTAALFAKMQEKVPFKHHFFGYIVDKQALRQDKKFYSKEYFYPVADLLDNVVCQIRPAGTYLTMHFRGTYMHNSQQALQKLAEYCLKHQLTPLSDIYVTSLLNYWTTQETQDYAYKIEVRIK